MSNRSEVKLCRGLRQLAETELHMRGKTRAGALFAIKRRHKLQASPIV